MSNLRNHSETGIIKAEAGEEHWPKMDRTRMVVVAGFEEADRQDREFWWSKTPVERMQALELIRQVAFGYGLGKPVPRIQRVLEVIELR